MAKTKPFNEHFIEYEQWFEDNKYVYKSELQAVASVLPSEGRGIEVGIGSGLFAEPLFIKEGCDPSPVMLSQARERGLEVVEGVAEKLPYVTETVDFILMVTAICFVDDVDKSLEEIKRVLKPEGKVIIGFVDKDSPVGQMYLQNKAKSIFYKDAIFFGTEEIYDYLKSHGFVIEKTVQTVFGDLATIGETQSPKDGYGEGSFVVIRAKKS